ncbi:MAG: DUF3052 family protein [Acidimicrobiia bacterium]|nr:DUF3052 family protein [Acidimicrobiia bacterium]
MTSGYSGTPLAKKLGIKPDDTLAVLNDPGHFEDIVEPLPGRVTWRESARGKANVVVLFTKKRSELERRIDSLGKMIYPNAMIWVCWPKKASKVPTDMTEDVVREVVLPKGLVDVKVCAVDDTWSGLKLMWRKELR